MRSNIDIDGIDILDEYGITLCGGKGAYNEIIKYPELKKTNTGNYHELDGIIVDLTAPKLSAKELSLSFACFGGYARMDDFIFMLQQKPYHLFTFPEIGLSRKLRMKSNASFNVRKKLGVFKLNFSDDFSPLEGYAYCKPVEVSRKTGYVLNDMGDAGEIDIARYGLYVLDGTLEEVKKVPDVKENLSRDISTINGIIYDGEDEINAAEIAKGYNYVTYKSKDVKLSLLMRFKTLAEFLSNYNAFLYNLTRPGLKKLYVDDTCETYDCYYKSSNVTEFVPSAGWLKFDVTLEFTGYRPTEAYSLLSTSNGNLIQTNREKFIETNK